MGCSSPQVLEENNYKNQRNTKQYIDININGEKKTTKISNNYKNPGMSNSSPKIERNNIENKVDKRESIKTNRRKIKRR